MRACRLPPAGPEEDAHKPAEEAGDGPGPAVQVTPASGIARFLLSDASSIQPGVTGVCEMGLMPDSELPVHPCGRQGGSRAAPSTPALAGLLCSFRRWRPPPAGELGSRGGRGDLSPPGPPAAPARDLCPVRRGTSCCLVGRPGTRETSGPGDVRSRDEGGTCFTRGLVPATCVLTPLFPVKGTAGSGEPQAECGRLTCGSWRP